MTQLQNDLLVAQQRYAEATDPEDQKNLRETIKSLRAAISDSISEGASPCPDCGAKAHGMMKREGTETTPPQFEVGCLNCPDHRARGWSERQAVEKWNQGAQSENREGWVASQ